MPDLEREGSIEAHRSSYSQNSETSLTDGSFSINNSCFIPVSIRNGGWLEEDREYPSRGPLTIMSDLRAGNTQGRESATAFVEGIELTPQFGMLGEYVAELHSK
jgi:hypothetical protein